MNEKRNGNRNEDWRMKNNEEEGKHERKNILKNE